MTKIIAPKLMICDSNRVENIVGKGENAGYQHFLLFPQCFQRSSSSLQGRSQSGLCDKAIRKLTNFSSGTPDKRLKLS